MTYRLLNLFAIVLSYIPLPVGRFLGRLMGLLISVLPIKRMDILEDNLQNSLGESSAKGEIKRLKRKVAYHFGQMLFEVPHILRFNNRNLEKYIRIVNEEHLLNAIKKEKGVFLLTGHLGNWEFICAAVSLRFGPFSVVAKPLDFKPLDRLATDVRTRFGNDIIPRRKAMRKILRALKQKKMVGILLDQSARLDQGVFVNFLGRMACTNKGLALMASRSGAPVIPTFAVRENDGRCLLIFEKEIELQMSGDKTRDIENNTALFARAIEEYIMKYPDQWVWFHRRWKTLPYCSIENRPQL